MNESLTYFVIVLLNKRVFTNSLTLLLGNFYNLSIKYAFIIIHLTMNLCVSFTKIFFWLLFHFSFDCFSTFSCNVFVYMHQISKPHLLFLHKISIYYFKINASYYYLRYEILPMVVWKPRKTELIQAYITRLSITMFEPNTSE